MGNKKMLVNNFAGSNNVVNEEGTSESGFLQNTTQHNLTTSRPEDRITIQPQTNLNQSPSLPYRTYIEETHIYNVLCLYGK